MKIFFNKLLEENVLILLFCHYSPFLRSLVFHLKKKWNLIFPEYFVPNLVEIILSKPRVIFISLLTQNHGWHSFFFTFCNFFPLEKSMVKHLNKLKISFIQRCFVASLVEIGLMVLKKKMFKYTCFQCLNYIVFFNHFFLWKNVALHFLN